MTYEQCQAILKQFRTRFPNVVSRSSAHGIQVVKDTDGEFTLQLVLTSETKQGDLNDDELLPSSFDYTFEGQQHSIPTESVIAPVAQAQSVQQGESASFTSSTSNRVGTAGWNVYLATQGIWVCVSNHHVLVDPGNPVHGIDIYLDTVHRAQLHAFTMTETWDWALARYNNPKDALQQFRKCSDNNRHPDARRLAEDISIGKDYRKTGRRTGCTTGCLRGVGDRTVEYSNGTIREFRGQLIFDNMGDVGDSGSIIVRDSDNAVTGLLFAGNRQETFANPLYKIGWEFLGTINLEKGAEIPVFDDSASLAPTSEQLPLRVGEPDLQQQVQPETAQQFTLSATSTANIAAAPPAALGGRFFLGEAVLVKNAVTNQEFWETPIPPPIRDVPVQAFRTRAAPVFGGGSPRPTASRIFYLCFG